VRSRRIRSLALVLAIVLLPSLARLSLVADEHPYYSVGIGLADEGLDYATRSDVLADLETAAAEFEQPDGTLVIPAATWVATATA